MFLRRSARWFEVCVLTFDQFSWLWYHTPNSECGEVPSLSWAFLWSRPKSSGFCFEEVFLSAEGTLESYDSPGFCCGNVISTLDLTAALHHGAQICGEVPDELRLRADFSLEVSGVMGRRFRMRGVDWIVSEWHDKGVFEGPFCSVLKWMDSWSLPKGQKNRIRRGMTSSRS